MDTTLPQKFPFSLDMNLAKANCTENQVCTSCDTVVLGQNLPIIIINVNEFHVWFLSYNATIIFVRFGHSLDLLSLFIDISE